jgi:hypothetical protein
MGVAHLSELASFRPVRPVGIRGKRRLVELRAPLYENVREQNECLGFTGTLAVEGVRMMPLVQPQHFRQVGRHAAAQFLLIGKEQVPDRGCEGSEEVDQVDSRTVSDRHCVTSDDHRLDACRNDPVLLILKLFDVVDAIDEIGVITGSWKAPDAIPETVQDVKEVESPRVVSDRLDNDRPTRLVSKTMKACVDGVVVAVVERRKARILHGLVQLAEDLVTGVARGHAELSRNQWSPSRCAALGAATSPSRTFRSSAFDEQGVVGTT